MRNMDIGLFNQISTTLDAYTKDIKTLPILEDPETREVFIKQLIDSIRRIKYVTTITERRISSSIANPYTDGFNPLKAAIYHLQNKNVDEACWLVFLLTHFGKSKGSGWLLTQDFYKGFDQKILSWNLVSSNFPILRNWIESRSNEIKNLHPKRTFSNHRKYESLRSDTTKSIYNVFNSYVSLIMEYGNHTNLFQAVLAEEEGCKYASFDNLYKKFSKVVSFGRTGKFDFLTMIGKLGMIDIEPPKTYMSGATGPLSGCRLLFGVNKSPTQFEKDLFDLCKSLPINPFGMQVLEDALCNWQKSPNKYVYFSG